MTTEKIKQKDDVTYVMAGEGYCTGVDKLCRVTDTQNGYQVKFYSHSSVAQHRYLSLDYDEAEYLFQALASIAENNNE